MYVHGKLLLDGDFNGANVHAPLSNGKTALMSASFSGHETVVRALLAAQANVNTQMQDGGTAFPRHKGGGGPESALEFGLTVKKRQHRV